MGPDTQRLFQVIFQEAQVVDFDFSQWDRQLRLVVSAGLVRENFEGRGPVHNVDFIDVRDIRWHANHLGISLDSPDQHCQWVIMDFDVRKDDEFEYFKLSGFGPTPTLEVVCKDVRIAALDPGVIDRVNPRWNRPSLPLARPGFEGLLALLDRE